MTNVNEANRAAMHAAVDSKINNALIEGVKEGGQTKTSALFFDKVFRPYVHIVEDAHLDGVDTNEVLVALIDLGSRLFVEMVVRLVEKDNPARAQFMAQHMIDELGQMMQDDLNFNFVGPNTPKQSILKAN